MMLAFLFGILLAFIASVLWARGDHYRDLMLEYQRCYESWYQRYLSLQNRLFEEQNKVFELRRELTGGKKHG